MSRNRTAPKIDFLRIAEFPAAFRDALVIDTDAGPKSLGQTVDPWQQADFCALDDAWRVVARRGEPVCTINRAYLERPRGHSKTNDIAVMVAWVLFASARSITGIAAAASKDQAKLLRDAVARLLRLNPWLADYLEVKQYGITNRHTESTLNIISADLATSWGQTPDFIVADELTHWPAYGEDFWGSLLSSAAKRANCLLLIITNAGCGEGTSWQWKVREAARASDNWHFSHIDGPQASWITAKQLQEQRKMLPAVAYDRLWENKWTTGSGDALPEADIVAAVRLEGPEIFRNENLVYVAGLDLGLSRDASALVVLGKDRRSNRTRLAHVQEWRPTPGNRVKIEDIEKAVLAVHKRLPLTNLAFDPWQAQYLTERLRKQGIATTEVAFSSPKNLQGMATSMIEAFSEREIELWDHPSLLADLRALRVVEKSFGFRLDATRDKAGHCDRAVALSLALMTARVCRATTGIFTINDDDLSKLPSLEELIGSIFEPEPTHWGFTDVECF